MAKQLQWEEFDEERTRAACAEIAASPNLRFLIRQLLDGTGLYESCHSQDPYETARLVGRQQIGQELRREMMTHSQNLSHELELETINETLQRARNESPDVAGSGDPDRGSDTSDGYNSY